MFRKYLIQTLSFLILFSLYSVGDDSNLYHPVNNINLHITKYLSDKNHKAFFYAVDSEDKFVIGSSSGKSSYKEAKDEAKKNCQEKKILKGIQDNCRLYILDDSIGLVNINKKIKEIILESFLPILNKAKSLKKCLLYKEKEKLNECLNTLKVKTKLQKKYQDFNIREKVIIQLDEIIKRNSSIINCSKNPNISDYTICMDISDN